MDAATGAAIIMGLQTFGKPAAQVVQAFVNAALAPTAKAIGTDFAESYNDWRQRRAERVEALVLKSAGLLEAANLQPQPVAPSILMPILEKASLITDDDLVALWAQLLASAAAGSSETEVRPAFPQILSELTPSEAHLLQYLYGRSEEERRSDIYLFDIRVRYRKLEESEFQIAIDNLCRLRLIELFPRLTGTTTYGGLVVEPSDERLFLTNLGEAFVSACRGPIAVS